MSLNGKTILVLGGSGLLGSALLNGLDCRGEEAVKRGATAPNRVFAPSHQELDVLDFPALNRYISALEPDLIFNCVAYTQVDKAESEPKAAMRYNRDLPKILGRLVQGSKSFLIHYSTDFVFDGLKGAPYLPDDATAPLCVYGASKLAGEEELKALGLENCAVLRTAWLYGPGGRNFVRTILGVCARNGVARVVQDQSGSPTYSRDLAGWSLKFAENPQNGIYHAVNSGGTSWYGLAAAAVNLAMPHCSVQPIYSAELDRPARRPTCSVLDNSGFAARLGFELRPWSEALREYLAEDGFLPNSPDEA